MADQPARYESPPESIELARETMRDIKAALTRDADGNFPARYAEMEWDGMNMQPPKTAWADMDMWERYDLLVHALDESIWSLERADRKELAFEFVKEEARQAMPGFRADAFDALTTRLEALGKEQTALAEKFGEFVSEAYPLIAKLAEARPGATRDSDDPAGRSPDAAPKDRLSSIAAAANAHDSMPAPEEWRKLHAEWTQDYGLRRMEDRGVSYEGEPERPLDHPVMHTAPQLLEALRRLAYDAGGNQDNPLIRHKTLESIERASAAIAEATRQYGPPAIPSPDAASGITDEQIHRALADRHEIAITWSTVDVPRSA